MLSLVARLVEKGWFRGLLLLFRVLVRKESFYGAYAFVFFVAFLLISYMALDDVFILDDHFFHIRFAESIIEQGPKAFTDFQSIYFSKIVSEHRHLIYYNFLFYLALLPFSLISPLAIGIKLFGVFALAGSLTIVYIFLRGMAVRFSFIWTLVFLITLAESGLIIRLLSARPFALAPVFLIALLYAFYRRRSGIAFLLAFMYFYWHTASFFLPVLLAVSYCFFDWYYRPAGRIDWSIVLFPFIGTVAAVLSSYLIFPGALSYVIGITLPVLFDAALTGGAGIAEGVEVYGASFAILFPALAPLIGPLILLGGYEIFRLLKSRLLLGEGNPSKDWSREAVRTTLFFGSVILLVASFFSLRFVDYFAYFCLPYLAFAIPDLFRQDLISSLVNHRLIKAGACVVLILFLMDIGPKIHKYTREVAPYLTAQGPTDWMVRHLAPGTLIFNTDWDAFPLLYYFTGDRFRYVTGLEPRLLYEYDPERYWLWRHIGESGFVCTAADCDAVERERALIRIGRTGPERWSEMAGNRIADVILGDFGTEIMLIRTDRLALIEVLDHSARFRKEYIDEANSIFILYRVLGKEAYH